MTKDPNDTVRLPVQPPLLMAIFLAVALIFGWKLPIPIPFPGWMQIVGWMVILSGLGLAFSAVDAMRRAGTSPDPRKPTTGLATSGPYQLSRNPIYLGYVAVVIGIPLIFGAYWGIVLAPVVVDAYNRLVIDREENYLKRKFGQQYTDYLAKVRRWL